MKVLLFEPGKLAIEADISGDLKSMQSIVGGMIEVTYPFNEQAAIVCNDEGLLMGLPLNRKLNDYMVIAGTFFICGIDEDSFTDLSSDLMEKFKNEFLYPQIFFRVGDDIVAIPYAPE